MGRFIIKRVSENGRGGAATTADYASPKKDGIRLILSGVYPGYKCTVDFGYCNDWKTPGRIDSIDITEPQCPEITVTLGGLYLNRIVDPGKEVPGSLMVAAGKSYKGAIADQHSCSVRVKMCRLLECGLPSEHTP